MDNIESAIADGTAAAVLSGGSYFVTETARILGGAGAALTPADGVLLLAGSSAAAEEVGV